MRTDPGLLLRGILKFVAVVLGAGLAGAGIGIALAELTGTDDPATPLLPATTERASGSRSVTATTPTTTSTTGATPVYRIPRVQVRSADGAPSESGAAVVTVRVSVTNRGNRALTIKTPVLVSVDDEVPLGSDERDGAGTLLKPIAPGAGAAGTLRFTVPGAVAQRLADTQAARLRIGNRSVIVKLTPAEEAG